MHTKPSLPGRSLANRKDRASQRPSLASVGENGGQSGGDALQNLPIAHRLYLRPEKFDEEVTHMRNVLGKRTCVYKAQGVS